MTEKARVIIEVHGGVVQAIWGGQFVEVLVIDHDDAADQDEGDYQPLWSEPDGPESGMDAETALYVATADAAR